MSICINTRGVGCRNTQGFDFQDVTVIYGNTKLELGLLNTKEQHELAQHLREVIDELDPTDVTLVS